MIKETVALLGLRATDKVTGFKGVITSACFDLYGCIQCALTPSADGKDEIKNGHWFDINRLDVSGERVMATPDFDGKGTAPATYDHGAAIKPPLG